MRVRTSGLAVLLVLAACGDDGTTDAPLNGGAGAGGLPTMTAGAGGAGIGASGAGAGGTPSAAGAGAGMGGATAGMSGAGMGGAMAGMGGTGGGMPGAPTWTGVWTDIISGTGCNGGPTCHTGAVGGMLLMNTKDEAYMNLVMKPAMGINIPPNMAIPNCKDIGMQRVVPNQPDMSLLVKKLEMMMPPCGGSMPPGGQLLSAAQQMQVRQWIMNGAKND